MPGHENPLQDQHFELLMQYVDGELTGAELSRAEALIASHVDAQAFVQDSTVAKLALREAVLEAPIQADLSRIRGRVMTKLPAEVRAPVAVEKPGIWAWLQHLGFGKVSFAVGAAVAAAVWLIATSSTGPLQHRENAGALAERHLQLPPVLAPGAEPEVIIEDTEFEDGGMMVQHGEHRGDATIIWHYRPVVNGKGEG
jgi:anti-sigma factor RsiW